VKQAALQVDLAGLRQLVERRGKSFAILELVQNCWDEPGVTEVTVSALYVTRGRVLLVVEDDAPEGFKDLRHAYTLFAPSRKRSNAEQRGRFNLGEKLVIALCDDFRVVTTTGGVAIDVRNDTRSRIQSRRDAGSAITANLRMTAVELEELTRTFHTLIPPIGIRTTFNGEVLKERVAVGTATASLATELADAEGFLRPTRRITQVAFYEPLPEEVATLYEMGIPVVETGDTYHINVAQKVPLNTDRDNVTPAFLRDVRALALNTMRDRLQPNEVTSNWVNEAMEDDLATPETIEVVLDKRYGFQRAIFDPSDPEANRSAIAKGYTLIPGRGLSPTVWDKVRESQLAFPAGQLFPSPKPFAPNGSPLRTIDPADYTTEQRSFAEAVGTLHRRVLHQEIRVVLVMDAGWPFLGCYGGGTITLNLLHLKPSLKDEGTLTTVIHEFAHSFGPHLTHEFDEGMARIAARVLLLHNAV
jgi:hypothetical protein